MADERHAEMIIHELSRYGLKAKQERLNGGHIRITWQPSGKPLRQYTCASSPSDWRGRLNARADIRRMLRGDGLEPLANNSRTVIQRAMNLPHTFDPIPDQIAALHAEQDDLLSLLLDLSEDIAAIRRVVAPRIEAEPETPVEQLPMVARNRLSTAEVRSLIPLGRFVTIDDIVRAARTIGYHRAGQAAHANLKHHLKELVALGHVMRREPGVYRRVLLEGETIEPVRAPLPPTPPPEPAVAIPTPPAPAMNGIAPTNGHKHEIKVTGLEPPKMPTPDINLRQEPLSAANALQLLPEGVAVPLKLIIKSARKLGYTKGDPAVYAILKRLEALNVVERTQHGIYKRIAGRRLPEPKAKPQLQLRELEREPERKRKKLVRADGGSEKTNPIYLALADGKTKPVAQLATAVDKTRGLTNSNLTFLKKKGLVVRDERGGWRRADAPPATGLPPRVLPNSPVFKLIPADGTPIRLAKLATLAGRSMISVGGQLAVWTKKGLIERVDVGFYRLVQQASVPKAETTADRIYAALDGRSKHLRELAEELKMPRGNVAFHLTHMKAKKLIANPIKGYWQRT